MKVAKYHTSKTTQAFLAQHMERLTVFQLPSYSPDYNPIEDLWRKTKNPATHTKYFAGSVHPLIQRTIEMVRTHGKSLI